MIQLPPNFIDTIRVDDNVLWIHFVNDAGQFFSHVVKFDPAIDIDTHLDNIRQSLTPEALAAVPAYYLDSDLTHVKTEPSDQNWRPAPVTALTAISLPQWRALKGLPNA